MEPAASAVLPTDNRDLAAAKRMAAVGDRIPTGVRAGWWRPCRADTCGCPIAAASISSTTATGTDPTARAMCWSCRPAGCASAACRPMRSRSGWAACCTSLPPALTTCGMPTPASTKWSARRRGQRDPFIRSAGRPPATTWWPTPRAARGPTSRAATATSATAGRWARAASTRRGATYAPAAEVANDYRRAMAACLSGRGYSVN